MQRISIGLLALLCSSCATWGQSALTPADVEQVHATASALRGEEFCPYLGEQAYGLTKVCAYRCPSSTTPALLYVQAYQTCSVSLRR